MHKLFFNKSYYYRYLFFVFKNGYKKILNINDWKYFPKKTILFKKNNFSFKKKLNKNLLPKYENIFKKNNTTALIIFKRDRIIFEKYNEKSNKNTPHRLLSISKIFISTLVGKFIKDKKINLNDKVKKYLPELKNKLLKEKTIHQLLTMDGGISYSEGYKPWHSWSKFTFSTNIKNILNTAKINNKEGSYFNYNNFYPCLLILILQKITKNNLTSYLKNKILNQIKFTDSLYINFDNEKNKFERFDMGINCSAQDLLKLGVLYLNNGIFNKKKILNKGWIIKSTSPLNAKTSGRAKSDYLGKNIRPLFSNKNLFFKYYWWGYKKNNSFDYFSLGKLGQIIYINKTKKTIFIRLGEQWNEKTPISEIAFNITNSI